MIKRGWYAINANWHTLRFRLISWYVLLLLLSLVFFSVYIFFQFREVQQAQQDTILHAAGDRLHPSVDLDVPNAPHFRMIDDPTKDLNLENVQVRLINNQGEVVATLGAAVNQMPSLDIKDTPDASLYTIGTSTDGQWRIFCEMVTRPDHYPGAVAWLEVGQPVQLLNAEFNKLFTPILIGTLIALVLAVLGGLFLANQALNPIDKVTRTAQSISTDNLSKRIDYHGPPDEIGRLAKTLDQMLDRLEAGFEQERRFTSDASHELRTPLTALKGRIEVTLNRARSVAEYQETLGDLNQGVDRLIGLTNSLLYLARLDQADLQWESEVLNLSDLLETIAESMEPVAELREISLHSNIPEAIHIQGNLDQLTRLFINLVDNALKYTPKGGQVWLQMEKLGPDRDKKVLVAVKDNGPGIAPEHLPHLFERFYRAESDRASTTGGTGLGLAIAYEIARQHGGSLEIESELGQGTTIKAKFPLVEVPAKVEPHKIAV
jgi:heavy metal sensor kinase